MKRSHKWVLGVACGLVAIGGLFWWTGSHRSEEVIYTVEKLTRGNLRSTVTANGEIQAKTKVNVGTPVTGIIKAIHVKDGQHVEAGDLLVTLDQERFSQELSQMRLGVKDAKQEFANAEVAWRRQEELYNQEKALYKEDLKSAEDLKAQKLLLENAKTRLERAKVRVEQEQARAAVGQDSLNKSVLRASISGQVTGMRAEKGETAIAGSNVAGAILMVISDMSTVLAEVRVGELDVVKVKPGNLAEVQVDALPGKVFQGSVVEVAASVDRPSSNSGSEGQSYKVRVQLSGDSSHMALLRPGMSARVAVLCQEVKNVLGVPLQAIQERETKTGGLGLMNATKSVVFVVNDGKVEERVLQTGVMTRRAVEVRGGVQEGEWVVTGPLKALAMLSNGKVIKTQTEAEAIKRRAR